MVVAQQQTPVAPVPPLLVQAKKVFVSNAGGDSGLFPHPFSGDQNRAYSEFYAGVKALGRFDIVSDPSDADLVLELQLTAPNGPKEGDKTKGTSDPLPMFRVVIWDRRTHFVLWTLTESVDRAYLQKAHDKNFDLAIAALVKDLAGVTSSQPQSQP
jgi:hypothetical protein